jgi:transcriptional regulator with XRE-family HTH domain
MRDAITDSPVSALLEQILVHAKEQGISGKDLAVRAGIAPETLSRMKTRGTGDAAVLLALAHVVGLKVILVPDDERLEAIRGGAFF